MESLDFRRVGYYSKNEKLKAKLLGRAGKPARVDLRYQNSVGEQQLARAELGAKEKG